MAFDWTLRFSDCAIVIATFLGPVAAVQAQKWVERSQQQRHRRVAVFRTLMSTRRQLLSPTHVEALNVVPVEFYGTKGELREIINAWKTYIDHLYKDTSSPTWGNERVHLLSDLIDRIGQYLGYHFNTVEISREVYSPKAHADIEGDQEIIRQGLAKVFRGEMAFPMAVKEFPVDDKIVESQLELQSKLRDWLSGQNEVKVALSEQVASNTNLMKNT